MTKINKKDIIDAVSEEAYLSKRDAKAAIDIAFDMIANSLKNGVNVDIANFGSFNVKERQQRKGTDPKTHQEITIKKRKMVSLKLCKSLQEELK